jgi:hypothetical protein
VSWLRAFYAQHGTKLLGALAGAWGTFVAFLAWLSSQPSVAFLLPPRYFAWFALASGAIGFFTIKRGFTNTRNLNDQP